MRKEGEVRIKKPFGYEYSQVDVAKTRLGIKPPKRKTHGVEGRGILVLPLMLKLDHPSTFDSFITLRAVLLLEAEMFR